MSEIRVTSVVGENGGDRVGLTTGLTVGPLTGTTGIGATITHHGHAQFAGVCTATSFSGTIPSSNLSGALPAISGANLTGISAGITMMDQWRIANDNTKGNDEVIDYNWERSDTFFAQIGTGMSESSGIFTFPQTGIYLILAQAAQSASNHSYAGFKVQISTDSGGSYSNLTYAYSNHLGGSCYANTHVHGVVDVTDESTFRCRMYTVTAGNTQYSGDTNGFRTGMTFIRLGDT